MSLCFNCGYANEENAHYCEDCGAPLQAHSTPTATSASGVIKDAELTPTATSGLSVLSQDLCPQTEEKESVGVHATTQQKPPLLRSVLDVDSSTVEGEKDYVSQSVNYGARKNSDSESMLRLVVIGLGVVVVFSIFGSAVAISWWVRSDAVNPNGNSNTGEGEPGILHTTVEMALIPSGQFVMGSEEGDEDSKPPHMVKIDEFYIDKYEVTCEDYNKFVQVTRRSAPTSWSQGSFPKGAARQPVTGVTWEDANAYCLRVGKRLPTEEEWEFAARGPEALRFPWGNRWEAGYANADQDGALRRGMSDVGIFKGSSPFGVFDMVGNAWEWTSSELKSYPGGKLHPNSRKGARVIRGGSWEIFRQDNPTTVRHGWGLSGDSLEQTGFRCAKDAKNREPRKGASNKFALGKA